MRNKDQMCPGWSPCAERFINSPGGAIVTIQDAKLSFYGDEPRVTRRNETSSTPRKNLKMLELKQNG